MRAMRAALLALALLCTALTASAQPYAGTGAGIGAFYSGGGVFAGASTGGFFGQGQQPLFVSQQGGGTAFKGGSGVKGGGGYDGYGGFSAPPQWYNPSPVTPTTAFVVAPSQGGYAVGLRGAEGGNKGGGVDNWGWRSPFAQTPGFGW